MNNYIKYLSECLRLCCTLILTMEKHEQLKTYIYHQIQSGINPDEIASQLRDGGWDEASIKSAFEGVQAQIVPSNPTASTNEADTATFQASGKKRGRIKTAWLLMRQSLKVLKNNKQLLRYPFMGGLITLLLTLIFGLIVFLGGDTFYITQTDVFGDEEVYLNGPGYLIGFIYYVLAYFVIFMYNTGLAAHVLDIFRGKSEHYAHYMGRAWSKKGPIFVFSLISATVGIILHAIERRAQWLGWIISRILGALWTLANLFTIPLIVENDISAPRAIKQSAKLFISRWGENIAARITFGGLMFLLYLLVFIPFVIVTGMLFAALGVVGFIIWLVILFMTVIAFAVIETAASQILSTALYYYAQYQKVPAAFDAGLLNSALVPKKKKRGLFGKEKTPQAN